MDMRLYKGYQRIVCKIDSTPCRVDTPKRAGAYLADWVIGGILTGAPGVFLYAALTKRTDMFAGLYVFESLGYSRIWAVITGLCCILAALFYYVYVPWKIYPGQTLGKKWAGFKITKLDGADVDLKTLLIRQVLCIFLLEGAVLVVTSYIRQLVTLSLSFYVDYYWQILGMIMMTISVILAIKTESHRTIHDYIAKTKLELVTPHKEEQTLAKTTVLNAEKPITHQHKSTPTDKPKQKYLPKKNKKK